MPLINTQIATDIIWDHVERESINLAKYACKSRCGKRKYNELEAVPDYKNTRTSFFRDSDRIIQAVDLT